jgi:hypothetical protein
MIILDQEPTIRNYRITPQLIRLGRAIMIGLVSPRTRPRRCRISTGGRGILDNLIRIFITMPPVLMIIIPRY